MKVALQQSWAKSGHAVFMLETISVVGVEIMVHAFLTMNLT